MIANVEPTGGVHRTFFDKKGLRVAKSAKMMLGPCSGGAVHLSCGSGPLVVAEGIETGLSLLSGPATVWAALSTSGMKALRLPDKAHKLVIATDGDHPGKQAGNALATRASDAETDAPDPFEAVDAWPDAVEGAALLSDIQTVINRFCILPEYSDILMAAWVLHAWTHDAADISPILAFISPEKRCGKTTALSVISVLAPKAMHNVNATPRKCLGWKTPLEVFRAKLMEGETSTR